MRQAPIEIDWSDGSHPSIDNINSEYSANLIAPTTPSKAETPPANKNGHHNGGQRQSTRQFSGRRLAKTFSDRPAPILAPEPSAALRDQLIAELKDLKSAEEAANWAHRVLNVKNTLTAADVEYVELAFKLRLSAFECEPKDEPTIAHQNKEHQTHRRRMRRRQSTSIDKTVLALPTPRRIRDREHVKSVTKQPCLVCGRRPADAHHLRFAQSRALGRKVSDEFTVPLCRIHHREVQLANQLSQLRSMAQHAWLAWRLSYGRDRYLLVRLEKRRGRITPGALLG